MHALLHSGVRTFHDILSAWMSISPAENPRGTSRNVAAMAASTKSTCARRPCGHTLFKKRQVETTRNADTPCRPNPKL